MERDPAAVEHRDGGDAGACESQHARGGGAGSAFGEAGEGQEAAGAQNRVIEPGRAAQEREIGFRADRDRDQRRQQDDEGENRDKPRSRAVGEEARDKTGEHRIGEPADAADRREHGERPHQQKSDEEGRAERQTHRVRLAHHRRPEHQCRRDGGGQIKRVQRRAGEKEIDHELITLEVKGAALADPGPTVPSSSMGVGARWQLPALMTAVGAAACGYPPGRKGDLKGERPAKA